MSDSPHYLRLYGPNYDPNKISGQALRNLLNVLVEGTKGALRFKLEGISSPTGHPPKWLLPAADFTVSFRPKRKNMIAEIDARPLRETLASKFGQQRDLFDDLEQIDPKKSPIELFEDALEDALEGKEDSGLFDMGLIATFRKFGDLFNQGLERLDIVNGRELRIDLSSLASVQQLAKRTKPPQPVAIVGRLEAIQWSDSRFKILLPNHAAYLGVAPEVGTAKLKKHWGEEVVVKGEVHFRPSGSVLRIFARSIEPATAASRAEIAASKLTLTAGEAETLTKLIADPAPPNPRLAEALKRFRQ